MAVKHWRSRFPEIAEMDRIHLNNGSVGPIPERGLEAAERYTDVWVDDVDPWDDWMDAVEDAVESFAKLINADIDEIAVMTSATQGMAGVASAFDYDERDEVVTSDLDFPTVPHLWYAQERRGASLRMAESDGQPYVPTEKYVEQISDQTQLVCTAHAYPFTGGLVDVEAVANAVHDHGGHMFLDAFQSTGVVPIDVKEQDIDMLVTGSNKFLLGGVGMAFLYVDRKIANELKPTVRGWFGVKDRFDFDIREPEYAPGTRRFEFGTPPVPAAYTVKAGIEILLEYGIENVRKRTVDLTGYLIEAVEERGFEVATPREDDRRGAVVNIQVKHPERTLETLRFRGVAAGSRNGGIRAGVHFYNTKEELGRFVDMLGEVATPR